MRTAWIGVLGAVMACNGDDGGSDATDDTGADTTTSPTSETTSPPTPTPTGPVGLLLRTGTLVWDGSAAAGTESLTLLGDSGYGAARCTLTYQLQSTEARADCEGCDWAFDLAIAGASVALDDGLVLLNGDGAGGVDEHAARGRARVDAVNGGERERRAAGAARGGGGGGRGASAGGRAGAGRAVAALC